jgi:hypothetical protein
MRTSDYSRNRKWTGRQEEDEAKRRLHSSIAFQKIINGEINLIKE